jgi:hypothetical protein
MVFRLAEDVLRLLRPCSRTGHAKAARGSRPEAKTEPLK